MRTQQEINIEYSKIATLAGHCQFRIRLLEEEKKQLGIDLEDYNQKLSALNKEKPYDPCFPRTIPESLAKKEDTIACSNQVDEEA